MAPACSLCHLYRVLAYGVLFASALPSSRHLRSTPWMYVMANKAWQLLHLSWSILSQHLQCIHVVKPRSGFGPRNLKIASHTTEHKIAWNSTYPLLIKEKALSCYSLTHNTLFTVKQFKVTWAVSEKTANKNSLFPFYSIDVEALPRSYSTLYLSTAMTCVATFEDRPSEIST